MKQKRKNGKHKHPAKTGLALIKPLLRLILFLLVSVLRLTIFLFALAVKLFMGVVAGVLVALLIVILVSWIAGAVTDAVDAGLMRIAGLCGLWFVFFWSIIAGVYWAIMGKPTAKHIVSLFDDTLYEFLDV